ncbi:heavy-metal-associated domain-containing protein [Amycolatopsis granulosa]|uniref:heavy-metal-associated domain-containing protein n=1 Tax=Amycolatopsis granulosa TaxID=185684 RepID=UPI00141DC7AA|nr:heavy-metal-associated domain-containing protein [Amycolatopsis granulosa]NIH83905.1 copper chaperone CopZ [Amycolatopsis granulosa]
MSTAVYTVEGMTCSGCMNKVTTAVTGLAGITDVDVDIATGEVTVTSDAPIDDQQVHAAIAGAGYRVAG